MFTNCFIRSKSCLLMLFMCAGTYINAGKLETAFAALAEYDYFKAKKLFYTINKKKTDPAACYGLSLIFSRSDNPFHSLDSAGKYINLSYNSFMPAKEAFVSGTWRVDEKSILALASEIGVKKLRQVKTKNSVSAFDHFLREFYLSAATERRTAIRLRDELEFDQVMRVNRSDSTSYFLLTHPQSQLVREAILLRERQVFEESTLKHNAGSYEEFLMKHPGSSLANTAYEKLYAIHKQNNDVKGLSRFVTLFPQAPQNLEAWKLLFSLSVKAYSYAELKRFLENYPAFPLKNSILRELELNKLELYPYKKDDFVGFVDDVGKIRIQPVYDAATEFREGLSLVVKGDSLFYINKENKDPFGKVYEEASVFNNGIAPVKIHDKWHFINRQGQVISGQYDEISELSDNVYVVRSGAKYGALDHFAQILIEPRFTKLGIFKNGYAYFSEDGAYGFVSKTGVVHNVQLEWISDFDSEGLAVIRKNDKYGLITSEGKITLEPRYDLVMRTAHPVYILVADNLYGFFSAERCYLSQVIYDYAREKPPAYYTDGKFMKLLKNRKQALMDLNGHIQIPFGQFDELNFPSAGLILVKKKNKYGYVDTALNLRIPFKYSEAEDFVSGIAIAASRDKYFLINSEGREFFSTPFEIEKLIPGYYLLDDETQSIIGKNGQVVVSGVEEIQKHSDSLMIVTLRSGEIKLISD